LNNSYIFTLTVIFFAGQSIGLCKTKNTSLITRVLSHLRFFLLYKDIIGYFSVFVNIDKTFY